VTNPAGKESVAQAACAC